MINRRKFLGTTSRGALGGFWLTRFIGAPAAAKTKVGKIGLQLYTVRRDMEKDFDGTLARVAQIGFKEVEFAGYFNRTPQQVRAALSSNKLSAPSAHVSVKIIRDELDKAIDSAKIIGHRYLICGFLSPDERKSLDDYKRMADLFNRTGERCRKAGLQFGYHNHDFEFVPLEGKIPFDTLLAETDKELVKIELDLYWIMKARQEPSRYFALYPGRYPLFHVKDMDNTPKRFFTEVGRGVIDFKKIFALSKQAGVKHYFVEQDESPGSAFDSIKISYDYLKRLEA